MTSPMTSAYDGLGKRVKRMQRASIERDQRMMVMSLVRQGKPEVLFEDLFSDTWKRPIVANFIQTVAQEQADLLSKLPALSCSVGSMRSDADKRRAATRNKIGTHYMRQSNLSSFMHAFADNLMTFGFAAMYAEPDYDQRLPLVRTMPSIGTYYTNDRFGNTLALAHCYKETVAKLCELFPQHAPLIKTKVDQWGHRTICADDEKVEVVQWIDDKQWCLFTPDRADLVLTSFPVVTKGCPVRVAELPTIFHEPQGNYDQLVWVQLARHRMALLSLEAGVKAVGAPLAVPRDVSELAVGPDAVLVTDSPEKVRRVALEVPNSAFALSQTLEQELRLGARYPEGRATGMDASVITGQGVHALMGSFDAQIATAQSIIGNCLSRVLEFCFETDDKVWPHARKRITGNVNGEPYDLTYSPAKDFAGVYTVDVSYGFAAGLSPNAAVVMLLQLRGDGLIDRSTVRRNMPFPIDDEAMQRSMDVEQTADALKQGLGGLLANVGQLAAAGQDPRPFLRAAATIIQGRRNGKDLADLFVEAFDPQVMSPPEEAGESTPDAETGPGEAAGAPGALGAPDPESMPGANMRPAGGLPDIQTLVAGLRNGRPQLDAAVQRRIPVGP